MGGASVSLGAGMLGAAHRCALAAPWLFEACGLQRVALLSETDNDPMLARRLPRWASSARVCSMGYLGVGGRARIDAVVLSLLPAEKILRMSRYWIVQLPPGVRTPFEVYVTACARSLGWDYNVSDGLRCALSGSSSSRSSVSARLADGCCGGSVPTSATTRLMSAMRSTDGQCSRTGPEDRPPGPALSPP